MPDIRDHVDRQSLIAEISDALLFDSGLIRTAQKTLIDADDKELVDLLTDMFSLRQRLEQDEYAFKARNRELFNEIAAWNRENKYRARANINNLLLALKAEEGSIVRLVEIIRKEHTTLRSETLNNEVYLGLYFKTADFISRTASNLIKNRIDLDEKIDLAELASESLVGINDVAIKHDAKPFEDTIYNCLQACIQVASLGGFDRNVDRFSSVVANELERIGPMLLDYVNSTKFNEDRRESDGDPIREMDRLLNAADVLKFWGAVTNVGSGKNKRDSVFEKCFGLYEKALDLIGEHKQRAPLVISRYSDARLHFVRRKIESGGIANRDEILSQLNEGLRLLSRITAADGDLRSESFNLIPLKLRELEFAMLAMEVDPSIDGLKSQTVSAIFDLAELGGDRLRTLQPWQFVLTIFSQIYDEIEEGVSVLEKFSKETNSPFARTRALVTAERLKGKYLNVEQSTEKQTWLDRLSSHPASIFSFKEALKGYNNDGFGPKGLRPTLRLDARFPRTGYAQLFRHLLVYDELLRKLPLDRIHENDVMERSGLLPYFRELFGKEQQAGLEELSKFLLRRGKSRLNNEDISASVELLQHGILYSDDAYWYGRLIDAYRHLRDFELARKIAAQARRKFPNDSLIAVQGALVEVVTGNYSEAASTISSFVAEMGRELSSCHEAVQGIYAYSMSRLDQGHIAEPIYREMVAMRPGDWRASHGLGCLLYRRGREWYPEALRVWTSTILIRNTADDTFQDWISRDCILSIAQTAKELSIHGNEKKQVLSSYLHEIGESLPTTKLVALMKGLMICGGLQSQVLCLAEHVSSRQDGRLSNAFTQCCMSMLVEDVIKQRDTSYAASVVDYALKHQTLGDLFGGAKGSYVRNLLRISANPIVERNFDVRWGQIKQTLLPNEWLGVAKIVSQSGYAPNYYGDAYESLEFAQKRDHSEVEEMLFQIIFRTANAMKGDVDRKKILLDESYPRSFSVSCEDTISDGLGREIYNCDPDKLRALLQHFEKVGQQNSDEGTSWELCGKIDNELQHSLMTSNIRTELIRADAFIASVASLPTIYN